MAALRMAEPVTAARSSRTTQVQRTAAMVGSGVVSVTGVAQAAHVDLNLALFDRTRRFRAARTSGASGKLDLGHALHNAALGANEVRMRAIVIVGDRFEPPHVIADVGATEQADLRQIGQIAIDRGAVPRVRGETIGNVAV